MAYAFTLQRLAYAMAEQEGWHTPLTPGYPTGSRSYRNNNPLNLRASAFVHSYDGGFCIFSSEIEGWAAALYDLRQKCRGNTTTGLNGDSTLKDLIYTWAPPSDGNDSAAYLKNVCLLTGMAPTITLKELL